MNDKNTTVMDNNQTKIPLTDEMIEKQAKKKIKKKFNVWLFFIMAYFVVELIPALCVVPALIIFNLIFVLPALLILILWKKKKYKTIESKQYDITKARCTNVSKEFLNGRLKIVFENGLVILDNFVAHRDEINEGEWAYLIILKSTGKMKNPICCFSGVKYTYPHE